MAVDVGNHLYYARIAATRAAHDAAISDVLHQLNAFFAWDRLAVEHRPETDRAIIRAEIGACSLIINLDIDGEMQDVSDVIDWVRKHRQVGTSEDAYFSLGDMMKMKMMST